MPFTQSPKVSSDISQRPQSKTWKCDFDTPGVWIDNSGIWGVWPINVVKNISSIRKLCHKVRTPAKTFFTHGIKMIKNRLKMPNFAGASTLRSSLYRSLLRSKQERKWHMQLFSTQRLVSNDLTKWLNNYDVQNGRVAKHRVYWKEHYQFLFEDTSLSNSRWTLRDLVAVLRDQAFAWERPGHWYANSHQRGNIRKTLFTETR